VDQALKHPWMQEKIFTNKELPQELNNLLNRVAEKRKLAPKPGLMDGASMDMAHVVTDTPRVSIRGAPGSDDRINRMLKGMKRRSIVAIKTKLKSRNAVDELNKRLQHLSPRNIPQNLSPRNVAQGKSISWENCGRQVKPSNSSPQITPTKKSNLNSSANNCKNAIIKKETVEILESVEIDPDSSSSAINESKRSPTNSKNQLKKETKLEMALSFEMPKESFMAIEKNIKGQTACQLLIKPWKFEGPGAKKPDSEMLQQGELSKNMTEDYWILGV